MDTGFKHQVGERAAEAMRQLERCGFEPFGNATQGSGNTGRALSADGTTWAELFDLRSSLRGSLRQLLEKGVLRGTGCTAQLTSELSNGERIVTSTASLPAAAGLDQEQMPQDTPLADLALRHFQRIGTALLRRHPLKLRIHGATEVAPARPRSRAGQKLGVAELRDLGVPERLALMIAGDCADTAELPH